MKLLTKIFLAVLGIGAMAGGYLGYKKVARKEKPRELGPKHKSPLKCMNDR